MSNTKKSIHFILQGKGGCGKSFIASALTQYFRDHKKYDTQAFDIDQVNTTLCHYKALKVEHFKITEKGNPNEFDPRLFDTFIENIITCKAACVIVDTGSNTFLSLLSYVIENQIFSLLNEQGINIFLHPVIAGGSEFIDTLHGTRTILEQINTQTILWINEFFGEAIDRFNESIISHEDYEYNNRIKGTVLLVPRNHKLHGEDIKIMTTNRLTLKEIDASGKFSLVARMRIKTIFKDIFDQLDAIDEIQ